MKVLRWLAVAWVLCACALPPAPPPATPEAHAMKKINLNVEEIDANGMVGPADGKRYVAYEFCIPRDEAKKAEVLAIDASIQFSNSPGRIRCTQEQYLCIGEGGTKETLLALAKLDYITRIDPFWGE
jgi:hypothetical protein